MTEMTLMDVRFNGQRNMDDERLAENLRSNLTKGRPSLRAGQALVIGGGPSIADHLDAIKEKIAAGFETFALNGAAAFLNANGVIPDNLVIYDARQGNVAFCAADARKYLVASYADPAVLEALAGKDLELFHVGCSDGVIKLIRDHEPRAHFLGGGSCVGIQIFNILVARGFRVAHLYGYDSSARDGSRHAYAQPMKQEALYTFEFQGVYYEAELPMAAQAREFTEIFPQFEKLGLHLEVFGAGLLPAMWRAERDRLRGKPADLSWEQAEKTKYERVWGYPQYRIMSEGEQLVPLFFEACAVEPGASVLDLGCGTGRAAQAIQAAGCAVTAVDLAANCLDSGVDIPFVEAALWDLPEGVTADWGFCCDVLEHIPEEKVDETLAAINKACVKGAFFNVSFKDSSFGAVMGEALHLTIRNYAWWIDRLEKHFGDTIFYIEETGVFYSIKPKARHREICCESGDYASTL